MSRRNGNTTPRLFLSSSVAIFAVCATNQATFAQTSHADHHHLMIGIDNLQTLTSGTYIGLPNPNYNRLSLLFPHQHDPVESSHFHSIGIYSYTGDLGNHSIIPTSTNNQIPEARYELPPLPLFRGTGVFAHKMISQKTEDHMYSDLKTKPVAHLLDDISDPYVKAIYNTGGGRWTRLLGENTTIALELISMTPGLGVANSSGEDLFDGVGDTYVMGTGDHFTFTPIFYVSKSAPRQTYSGTFKLVDVSDNPLFGESGEFTLNFEPVPEPITILGTATALGFGTLFKRKLLKKNPKK
ncbi:all3515 family Zur-repressed PEP-CTERM protein [Gloeothece citriformis]|nr:all3515 family Zur-repressed PEP-CTERM protein [Gloeothece citriformis]